MRYRYGQLWSQLDGNNKLPGQKGYDETDDLKRVQKALRSLKVYIDNKPDINKLKDVLEHNHNIWLNKKRYVTEKIHEMLDESKF